MSQRSCSRIHGSLVDTLVGILLATPLLGLALADLVFSTDPMSGPAVAWSCRALSVLAVVAAAVFSRRLAQPPPRLRVTITDATIAFHQRGRRKAKFWRDDIDMVVLEQGRVGQASCLSVYGPARSVLDTWETGWIAKPTLRVMDILEQHGYPHALRHIVPSPSQPEEYDWSLGERRRSGAQTRMHAVLGPVRGSAGRLTSRRAADRLERHTTLPGAPVGAEPGRD